MTTKTCLSCGKDYIADTNSHCYECFETIEECKAWYNENNLSRDDE